MTRPAFDSTVFEQLVQDVDSFDVAFDFTLSFLALMPGRIQRIDRALKARDREETLVALLSLQASAAMVGARQLEASATHALAHEPVENTSPGPLKRKLEGQADMFREAFAKSSSRRNDAADQNSTRRRKG